jgi:cytochrome oxidase Cu insertion factor (SCO1/SenC/PrrC family)
MTAIARSRWRSIGLGLALGLAAGAIVAAVLIAFKWFLAGGSTQSEPSRYAYEGTRLEGPAPDFRLLDQSGTSVSLSDFRGRVVVLSLLDPYCTDICPIYAYHFRLAHEALGQDAAKVAFLALNANDEKTAVDDVMAATQKWGMDEIPAWHFLTGSAETLRAVWNAYGMVASGPPKPGKPEEKAHSPAIYIIDHAGQRRWYLSTAFEGAPPASALIVKHVKALLAEGERGKRGRAP